MVAFGISDELIARVRARAADPARRIDSRPIPDPATADALARAETALGFELPLDLRRLYLEVADGGFGPGGGLLSLEELVTEYRDLTDSPAGPRGQAWPARLLPLLHREPGYDCVGIGGRIVAFDPEELAVGDSDRHWQRAFKPEADSLRTYFTTWVGRLTPEEERAALTAAMLAASTRRFRANLATLQPDQRVDMESAVYPEFR